jgi:hypothetical protein
MNLPYRAPGGPPGRLLHRAGALME